MSLEKSYLSLEYFIEVENDGGKLLLLRLHVPPIHGEGFSVSVNYLKMDPSDENLLFMNWIREDDLICYTFV